MENKARPARTDSRNSQDEETVKLNPSDFLPRRTSRTSAQAASEAIKRSVKEEKSDPCKQPAPSNSVKKDGPASTSPETKQPDRKRAPKRKRSLNDCFVKLVRCEDDPTLRSLVALLKLRQKLSNRNTSSVKEPLAKKVSLAKKQKLNGDPASKYEIVYAPIYHSEKIGHNHISHVGPQKTVNKIPYAPTYASEKDLKTSVSGSKVRQPSNENLAANASMQKSLSLVVVHPKPGSTIVNTKKGRPDKRSSLLQQMISDPNSVISNNVSRVTASGMASELKCDQCSVPFQVARDLINHKYLVHGRRNRMCITCTQEFPSADALQAHVCPAKFRCEICGVKCKTQGGLFNHKRMAHSKTLGSYICYKCCFHATSQSELDTHLCGGRPLVTPIRGRTSAPIMVYPAKGAGSNSTPTTAGRPSNIYVNLSPSNTGASTSTQSFNSSAEEKKFLCEVCLEMFSTESALESHKCGQPSFVKAATSAPVMPGGAGSSQPQPSLPFEVLPEVEQLAKYYTSMVFKE